MKHKVHLDDIVTTLLLTLPRLQRRWGECSILPEGLPLLKSVNEDMLKAPSLLPAAWGALCLSLLRPCSHCRCRR